MVSLLLPTRKRPDNLKRFYESAMQMADKPTQVEVVVYVDDDDDSYDFKLPRLRYVRGPRIVLSKMWNECYKMALGPIYGHMGDDIVFRNQGWDTLVKEKFKEFPDKIVFVHGDDMSNVHLDQFGTHGFIHKNWVDAVGYFVPPYFSSDYNDTWLNDVANALGRRVYIHDLKTEHMHFAFNKGTVDITHEERLKRHENDNVGALYQDKEPERIADVEKLKRAMGQDLSIYTPDYYNREINEYWFAKNGLLRPDQLACICYALGLSFWGEPTEQRNPGQIYSIGCGAGDLELALENLGHEVIGVDPSAGAKELYKGKTIVDEYPGGGNTIIFCEAIEHIPREQINEIFAKIPQSARIIIANWPDYHPLPPDPSGKDHITLIDDAFYDEISVGRKVILRRGSHLVMEGI